MKKPFFSKRNVAILIGISLLLMAILAIFAVPPINELFVLGDPIQTGLNVTAKSDSLTLPIISWIGILILDLVVSWGVYRYYKKDKPKLANASGIFRLIYSLFLVVAILQLIFAATTHIPAGIYSHLSAFTRIWGWGLIVFGLHLIMLGITYTHERGKKWLSILIKSFLIIAGIGYMIQYIGILFVADPIAFAAAITRLFILFMILGEIIFAVWMLIKGGTQLENTIQ